MVKHTQKIRRLLPTNCLSVFEHFVRLAIKGLTWKKYENLQVDSSTIKNNYPMINPTHTSVYLYRMFRWRQINVRKIFPQVINVSCGQRQTIFTDFNLNCI